MLKLSYLNVTRRKTKSLMTVCITIVIVMTFVAVWSVYSTTEAGIKLSGSRMGADVLIFPNSTSISDVDMLFTGVDQMVYMDKTVIDGKLPIDDISNITSQFFVQTKPGAGCCDTSQALRIVGVEMETDFILKPWLDKNGIKNSTKNGLIIGSSVKKDFGAKTFVLNYLFTVSGVLYPTGTGMDNSLFIDIDQARELASKSFELRIFNNQPTDDLVTCYLIKLKQGVDTDEFIQAVKNNGLDANITSISSVRTKLQAQIQQLSKLLFAFWIAMMVLGCFALIAMFSNLTSDRKSEIGYLRTIGMKKYSVLRLFMTEVLLLGGIGGIIGSASGILLTSCVLKSLDTVLAIPKGEWGLNIIAIHFVGGCVLSVVICLISALMPVIKISCMEPQEAISQGEM